MTQLPPSLPFQTHEKAFSEIKVFYNDITHSNLDLIKSLKEDVAKLKKAESTDEKMMFEIAQENKRMSEPLKQVWYALQRTVWRPRSRRCVPACLQALADVERLHAEREAHNRDVKELEAIKARLLVGTERLKALQWEHEVLEQRFERAQVPRHKSAAFSATVVLIALSSLSLSLYLLWNYHHHHDHYQKERDELYESFQKSLYDVQQKTGFKNLLLVRDARSTLHIICNLWVLTLLLVSPLCSPTSGEEAGCSWRGAGEEGGTADGGACLDRVGAFHAWQC